MDRELPDESSADIDEYVEEAVEELSPRSIAEEVGAAARARSHLEPDSEEVCGYCGQAFGPEAVAVERSVYGRKWRFCDETCLGDFMKRSDFKDQDLDEDRQGRVELRGS